MRRFSFYHAETGEVHNATYATNAADPEKSVAANTPPGHKAIEATLDHLSHRVNLSDEEPVVVDYQPPKPSDNHEWNGESRRWEMNAAAKARETERREAWAEIRRLQDSQHDLVRGFLLGRGGEDGLKEIDAKIAVLRTKI